MSNDHLRVHSRDLSHARVVKEKKRKKRGKRVVSFVTTVNQTMVKNGFPKGPTVMDKHVPPKLSLRHLIVDSHLLGPFTVSPLSSI